MDISEAGYDPVKLVRLRQTTPMCFSMVWYWIFVCLTMAEFYKIYFDTFFVYQEFKITKLVSKHTDLNSEAMVAEYSQTKPTIVYLNQTMHFDQLTMQLPRVKKINAEIPEKIAIEQPIKEQLAIKVENLMPQNAQNNQV